MDDKSLDIASRMDVREQNTVIIAILFQIKQILEIDANEKGLTLPDSATCNPLDPGCSPCHPGDDGNC
jgi:hypothetical protein